MFEVKGAAYKGLSHALKKPCFEKLLKNLGCKQSKVRVTLGLTVTQKQ